MILEAIGGYAYKNSTFLSVSTYSYVDINGTVHEAIPSSEILEMDFILPDNMRIN
jgi:hypothetical protein